MGVARLLGSECDEVSEMTVVGDRILTWGQLLEHLRIARRRMQKTKKGST